MIPTGSKHHAKDEQNREHKVSDPTPTGHKVHHVLDQAFVPQAIGRAKAWRRKTESTMISAVSLASPDSVADHEPHDSCRLMPVESRPKNTDCNAAFGRCGETAKDGTKVR